MRRRSILILGAVALLLAGATGLYAWWWHRVADALVDGLPAWAAARTADGLRLGWRAVAVDGFPLAFRIRIDGPTVGRVIPPTGTWQADGLEVSARPWRLTEWQIAAPAPSRLSVPVGPSTWSARIAAIDGTMRLASGVGTAEIVAREVSAESADPVRIASVRIVVGGPPSRPDAAGALTATAERVSLPESVPAILGREIDSLTVAGSLVGTIPPAPPATALELWRAAGGIVELDRVALRWADLMVDGSGTLALDRALQPLIAGTATVSGHIETIDALTANGMMRLGEAIGAKLVLGALSRPAEDGRPSLRMHITMQDGRLSVGPEGGRSFRVGRIPPIRWPDR